MRHISQFFHFHDGEPDHRAVKILGCLVGAIMLAMISASITAIRAMETTDRAPSTPHLINGCPKVDAPANAPAIALADDRADIVWFTTDDTDANEIALTVAGGDPFRIPATGGRVHRASVADIIPGATYAFRITSRSTESGAVVQSGICTFTVPGDDRSAPEILHATIQDVGTTTVTVAFTTMEPARGWVRMRTNATPDAIITSSVAADDPLTTTHALTLTGLVPGQTYIGSTFAVDGAGNSATVELPPFVTLSDIATDDEPPTIDALECQVVSRQILVTFTVPELAVSGSIVYGPDTDHHDEIIGVNRTLEAAPTANAVTSTTTFARTLTDLEPNVPYTITASATDAAGNTTHSSSISCLTTGP